jgi:hypothetical protein
MPFSSVLGASSVIKPGVCTSSTRPTVPYEGQLIYETDTDRLVAWNGSAWVHTAPSGLVPITAVSFTTSSAVAFATGVFTSTYKHYRVLFEFVPSATCSLACQVNAGGVARTANSYFGNRYDLRAGAVVGANPGTSHTIMGANGATPAHNTFSIDVMMPADAAVRTSWHGTWYGANAAGLFDGGVTSAEYNVAEAHDGLTLTPSTGTITGSYKVYGYN